VESHGGGGAIQVTECTYERLRERYVFEERGAVEIKGRGPMRTYFLVRRA
jgi:class 3 adenylate cyclase